MTNKALSFAIFSGPFGGKEDRLPYVEQAFINAEEGID